MAYLIGTAGHVDHGKTTLIARLTGIDTDRLPEEKARGMTIDLGFAYIELEGIGRVSIVDVPGHERFIKNMLAGAGGVDVAMLCVASDEGVMPQTREHFEILRLLEARTMVVALTKCDLSDPDAQGIAELEVQELLSGSPYESAPIVRVSAHTGSGLDELKSALAAAILSLGARQLSEKNWFLPIDRVFTVAGHGTIITGTLAQGRVNVGSDAVLMPGDEKVRIRSIQTHGISADFAEAGQRTALNVAGIKKEELHRGQAVGAIGALVETDCINVRLTEIQPPKHGERIRAHVGAGEFLGKLFLLDHAPGFAQIRFEEIVGVAKDQRIVLRRYSPPDILAGGQIVTPNAKVRRKGDEAIAEILSREPDAEGDPITSEINRHPLGVETGSICEALGRTAQELGDRFESLKNAGEILGFAGIWISTDNYPFAAEKIRDATMKLHQENAQASSVTKSRVVHSCGLAWSPKSLDRLIAKMDEDGLIVLHGGDLRHPDHEIKLNDKQAALLERVVAEMENGAAVAPSLDDLMRLVGAPGQAIEEMWRLGSETGRLIKVEEGMYYSAKTLVDIEQTVITLAPKFTVAQFRDATGSSRKFALPLLQYFDSKHVTRRVGEERAVVKSG